MLNLKTENGRYVLEDPDLVDDLYKRGFGIKQGSRLIMEPIEVAYLATQRYKVIVNNSEVTAEDLLKGVDNFLKYVVYCDLRRRGYYVRPAQPDAPLDLVMWEKGKKVTDEPPRYGIKIVTEGLGIRVIDLASILKYCESMGLQLVLALVSNDGVVTYYKAFSLKPERPLK